MKLHQMINMKILIYLIIKFSNKFINNNKNRNNNNNKRIMKM